MKNAIVWLALLLIVWKENKRVKHIDRGYGMEWYPMP